MVRRNHARWCFYLLVLFLIQVPATSPVWSAGKQPAALPRVTILATGGTIAGQGTSATRTTDYTAGVLDIGALIKSVPGLEQAADIRGEQVPTSTAPTSPTRSC